MARTVAAVLFLLSVAIGLLTSCAKPLRRSDSPKAQSQLVSTGDDNHCASKLNINTASATEMEKLPGVGRVLAERIIAYRDQYGLFRRKEHLMMVPGISDRKFREIRGLLTVE